MAQAMLLKRTTAAKCTSNIHGQGSGGALRATRPAFCPVLPSRGAQKKQLVSPCHFRDATKEQELDVSHKSWRRHFMESDPPDESQGPQALIQRAKASMRDSKVGLVDIALPALGGLGGFALNDAHDWSSVAVGIAAGIAARLVQANTIEQKVPFTLRKHTLLLPVFAELLLGQFSFAQVLQQPQYRGKALPAEHRDSKLVQKIAERIISAVEEGHGGGFQKHIRKFDWEVVVLDDDTVNAFVLPGGKIVVFTGLIKLMDRNEDMLATVIGHECAHALARHSSEKITLGLFIALAVQLAAYAAQRTMRSGQPYYDSPYAQHQNPRSRQQSPYGREPRGDPRYNSPYGREPRDDPRSNSPYGRASPYPYSRNPYSNPYDNPYYHQRNPYTQSRGGRSIYYVFPQGDDVAFGAAPGRLPRGYGPPRGGPPRGGYIAGGLINIATNLLLQLPFSRRAEAEADLIGLKLMAIAGYNPNLAPTTFAKMEEYQGRMMGKAAANASYIQDHPRSANRVKLLEGELDMMKQFGEKGKEVVLSKVPYWML